MELKLVNYNVGYIESQTNQLIIFGFHNSKKKLEVNEETLVEDESILFKVNRPNALLGVVTNEDKEYFIHIKEGKLIITRYLNGNTKGSLMLKFTIFDNRFEIVKTKYSYNLFDKSTSSNFALTSNIFEISHNTIAKNPIRRKKESNIYLKIRYSNYYNFVEYNVKKEKIVLKTLDYSVLGNRKLKISFSAANELEINLKGKKEHIKISDLLKKNHLRLNDEFKEELTEPVYFRVGKRIYVLIKNSVNNNCYIKFNTRVNLMLKYSEYEIKSKKGFFYVEGKIEFKENPHFDSIMTNKGKILSKLVWKSTTNFTAKIKKSDIYNLPNIHTSLMFCKSNEPMLPMKRYNKDKVPPKKIVYTTAVYKDKVLVARLNLANNISISIVPKLPVYNTFNQMKIEMAYLISKRMKKIFPKKINLYFEKEASRIGESGSYVFEKVMQKKETKSSNYYILDKKSNGYPIMKRKWGSNLVERFSFKHYLLIFLSTSFISSELSSHVISGRLYSDKLNKKIKDTPLYFLQHGIMFAKPVDNPMAAGFHKKNMLNNVVKNVISSDLEAREFYKMGYDKDDLMKTGLPKFDGAQLNDDADKITYMPTWRYWEEAEIINGNIQNTTYYDSFIKLIKAFEKADLLNNLQITAHNKFTEFISESLPQYKSLICEDPTEALKNSKIFITDYSSIIYDAIYRGTYPIFYWKDKDYLIKNYQAIPPVNELNAPGEIAYSEDELLDLVFAAIKNDCKIEEKNLNKYRRINEFYDNNNTERVISILKKENVL